MNRITVKPKEGLTVIDPATHAALPAEGAEVEGSVYWHRRLTCNEVELVEPAKSSTNKPVVKSK